MIPGEQVPQMDFWHPQHARDLTYGVEVFQKMFRFHY
jgi:hypothetical protein